MEAMNFDAAFTILVNPEHEGGFSNNPADPGGMTRYGISKRSYPDEDILNLTLDRAKFLYKRDYWDPAGCDALPDALRYEVFDLAVNTSARGAPKTAIRLLQSAVGADQDGILGPHTLMSIASMPVERVLRRLTAARIRYYTGLKSEWWSNFGRGVMNRVATNLWNA